MSKPVPSQSVKHAAIYLLRLVLALLALLLVLILAIPIGFYGMAMLIDPKLPSVNEIKKASTEMPLQIYSQDEQLIGQYGNRMSLPVTYEKIPKPMVQALLAAEDASFYEHSGISIKGLGRAVTEVISANDTQTGGSTITMQVAKNYFLTPERTFSRKLTELYLARKIESELSKEDILTLYVNKIYMGEGAYGIRAGAKKYYGKPLDKLSVAQMAMLAGLPKAPSQNNPVANPDNAVARRNWILGRMLYLGYISQDAYDAAIKEPIGLQLYRVSLDANMPYLAEMTRQALVDRYGEAVINSGWRVQLTVDSKEQIDAEQALETGLINYDRRHGWRGVETAAKQVLEEEGIEGGADLSNYAAFNNMYPAKVTEVAYRSFKAVLQDGSEVDVPWSGMSWAKFYLDADRISGYPRQASQLVAKNDIVRLSPNAKGSGWQLTQVPNVQGSIIALDPETGALQALVGGFDYKQSKFNRATQGWRQPGSTIKPLIYTAALEKGYRSDSMISDSPLQVGDWKPKNSDGRFYGDITLRRGLYLSRNLVSIRLLRSVGTADARHLLDQLGLDKQKLPTTLSLALGTGQTTPLQMATAYATFANGGHRVQPYFIDAIYTYDNQRIYQANPQRSCATCFNTDIESKNKQSLEDFSEQQEQMAATRVKDIKLLQETGLLANITASLQAGASTQDIDDLIYDELTTSNDDSTDTKADKTDNALSDQVKRLRNLAYAMRYAESAVNDRLQTQPVQYVAADQAPRVINSAVAYEMAGILRDVVQKGTARRAKSMQRFDIGGKTGTTNEAKDAWFAGFHPSLVSVVWVGFDTPSTLGKNEYGGVAALPIWIDFMSAQLNGVSERWVNINNVSKTKKKETEVIDITNENGVITRRKSSDSTDSDASQQTPDTPVEPAVVARDLPPAPEPPKIENRQVTQARSPVASLAPANPQDGSANPLTAQPVEAMPELQ